MPEGMPEKEEQEQELAELNRVGLLRLCLVFVGVGTITILLALLSSNTGSLRRGTVLTLVSMALWGLSALVTGKPLSRRGILGLFYAVAALMLSAGIWTGSFGSPEMPAFTFPVFLLALPTFLADRSSRLTAFSLGMTVVFLVFSFLAKSRVLFLMDLRHMLVVLFVGYMSSALLVRNRREAMRQEQALKDSSFRDALTGLLNKRGVDRVRSLMDNGVEGTLILLDLDRFKEVNDSFGHAMGDRALSHVACAMRRSFRSTDHLLRIGGDEFAVYSVGMTDPEAVGCKLSQLRAAVAEDARGCPHVTCSLGAAVWKREGPEQPKESYDALFQRADAALYRAKENGRDGWVLAE